MPDEVETVQFGEVVIKSDVGGHGENVRTKSGIEVRSESDDVVTRNGAIHCIFPARTH